MLYNGHSISVGNCPCCLGGDDYISLLACLSLWEYRIYFACTDNFRLRSRNRRCAIGKGFLLRIGKHFFGRGPPTGTALDLPNARPRSASCHFQLTPGRVIPDLLFYQHDEAMQEEPFFRRLILSLITERVLFVTYQQQIPPPPCLYTNRE